MKSKKPIKTVVNPKDNVIQIRTVVGDPTTLLITGQQPDVTRIELTDSEDHKETYEVIVQLDVEYLKTQIRRAVPTANVTPIPSSNNAIILTGTVTQAGDVDVIRKVAGSLGGVQVIDAMRVGGVMQVQLDVVVASVSRSLTRNIGFDWAANSQNSFFGNYVAQVQQAPASIGTTGALSTYPVNGLTGTPAGGATFLFGVLHSGWGLLGFLEALKTEGIAKFMAQPSLVTLSGRPATFLVGGDQAVPVVGGIGGATGVSFEPFGTQIMFLPIVLGNGKIHMEVAPSITSLNQAFGTILAGNPVPGHNRTSANTTVELESGQTFVIGGLTQHSISANSRRTPFLGELPFVSNFFSTRATTDTEEELLILVTPHLVDAQDCAQVTRVLPGQETRIADDFELYLEGILEAPRGARRVFQNRHYVPAYKNGPSIEVYPCAGPAIPQYGHRGFQKPGVREVPDGMPPCAMPGGPVPAAPTTPAPMPPGPGPQGLPAPMPIGSQPPPAPIQGRSDTGMPPVFAPSYNEGFSTVPPTR